MQHVCRILGHSINMYSHVALINIFQNGTTFKYYIKPRMFCYGHLLTENVKTNM